MGAIFEETTVFSGHVVVDGFENEISFCSLGLDFGLFQVIHFQ